MAYPPQAGAPIWSMLDYDPKVNLTLYPIPMARFGSNPFGENLYRIVLGKTRRSLGATPVRLDGDGVFRWTHTYAPEFDNQWILERWVSGYEAAQMSREAWNQSMQAEILGPYPDRGDYQRCEVNLVCSPTEANLEKLISWIEESRRRQMSASGLAENKVALEAEYAAQKKAKHQKAYDIAYDACSAFLDRPLVSTSDSPRAAKRGTKTRDLKLTTEQLGLPTKGVFKLPERLVSQEWRTRA